MILSTKRLMTVYLLVIMILLIVTNVVYAVDCYIKKNCFAVIEPHLVEKVCFLWEHDKVVPREAAINKGALPSIELDPDQLEVSYLKLVVDKKFLPLSKGTPIFPCGNDLNAIQNDPGYIGYLGANYPAFNCRGVTLHFVPVMPVNYPHCYWIAAVNIECRFYPLTKRALTDDEYE